MYQLMLTMYHTKGLLIYTLYITTFNPQKTSKGRNIYIGS